VFCAHVDRPFSGINRKVSRDEKDARFLNEWMVSKTPQHPSKGVALLDLLASRRPGQIARFFALHLV
jgi:hypothetical protein